jgi:hypothetical protein
VRILAIVGAIVAALVLFLVWILVIWPIYLEPIVTDRDIAIVQRVLHRGMTRAEVDAMIATQIPTPHAAFDAEDAKGVSSKIIQYEYKDELCDRYYKEIIIDWSHDRAARWTVNLWGPNSCFN